MPQWGGWPHLPKFDAAAVQMHRPFTRHAFSAAAILTLQAPDRTVNPYDLRIFASRWHALVGDCGARTSSQYGVGVRYTTAKASEHVIAHYGEESVELRGEPGDLYVFNSEFLHSLPPIQGDRSRAVLGAIVGYSAGGGDVEIWS